MTMNLKTVSSLFKRHQADLRQHGVKSLAVFGSLARGEAGPNRLRKLYPATNPPTAPANPAR